MRRSTIFTALALGAQAAWAQDTTEPAAPDTAVVEAAAETTTGQAEATDTAGDETVVGDDTTAEGETETAGGEPAVEDDGAETAGDDGGADTETAGEEPAEDDDEIAEGEEPAAEPEEPVEAEPSRVHVDNRSATGAIRGGHRGSVSTLARAGLGPVFGKLRSQGYGDIRIEQLGDVINVSAARGGELRQLSYSASTGALLSDGTEPRGLIETIAGKLRAGTVREREAARADRPYGRGKDGMASRAGGDSKRGEVGARGGSKGEGGSKGGDSRGGGSKGGGSKGGDSKGGGSKGGGSNGGGSKGDGGSKGGGSNGGGHGGGQGGGRDK